MAKLTYGWSPLWLHHKMKGKKEKEKKKATHYASNSLSILCYTWCFPKQIFLCSCVKTLIWTCSLKKAQVMWWTWFSWRLWGCSCSHPTHFSPLLQDDYTRACHTSLKVCCKVTWHLHGVGYPPPCQRQQESLVLKDESTSGVIRVSEMAPNPWLLFIQAVLWSHNWSIVAELSSVSLILTINQL